MSQELDEQQTQELREAFNMFDESATGMINVRDLPDLLRSLGHNPNKAEMRATISEVSLPKDLYTFMARQIVLSAFLMTRAISDRPSSKIIH